MQKGCMEEIPGCWKHLSMMVWHALKEASTQKSNLAVIWLDIANALWVHSPQIDRFCCT